MEAEAVGFNRRNSDVGVNSISNHFVMEKTMGTVTAIEKVDQIRRELREYDLSRSECPVCRFRFQLGLEPSPSPN